MSCRAGQLNTRVREAEKSWSGAIRSAAPFATHRKRLTTQGAWGSNIPGESEPRPISESAALMRA